MNIDRSLSSSSIFFPTQYNEKSRNLSLLCSYLMEETMTENEKTKGVLLKWWLIIVTVLSIIILFGLNSLMLNILWELASNTLFMDDELAAMANLIIISIAQIVLLIPTIILIWIFFKKGLRLVSIILSFVALGISVIPSFTYYLYYFF